MNKKAFTLVELIVVITILAVLATVAFVSFQWYSQSARDSARLADIQSMTKVLELFKVKNSKYPNPDSKTNITYSWAIAWSQWVFGTSAYPNSVSMSNIPVDPVTGLEYPYSRTANWQEYQIAAVLENPITTNLTQSTYAWTQEAQVYVKWNYNGKFLRVSDSTTMYLLWVPSILASHIDSATTLETIIQREDFVYKGYKNLPASFSWSIYNTNPVNWFDFTPVKVVLFEWNKTDLETDQAKRVMFLDNLQTNYTGTIISTETEIAEVLAVSSSSQKWTNLVATVLNNTLKTAIPTVKITSNTNEITPEIVSDCNNLIWIPFSATQLLSKKWNDNKLVNLFIPTANAFEFPWGGGEIVIPGGIPPIVHYAIPLIDLCDNVELWFANVDGVINTNNTVDVYKVNLAEYEEYEINVSWAIREQILIFDKEANGLLSEYDGISKYSVTYSGIHYIVVAPYSWDPINYWTYNIDLTHNINVAAPVPNESEF